MAAKKSPAKKTAAKKAAPKKAAPKKVAPKKAAPKRAVSSLATFHVYQDAAGGWRWRLQHQNGNIIADSSEAYSSKEKALEGARSVKANAAGAAIGK